MRLASSAPLTLSSPSVMSPWPPTNLVPEVMLMSAPRSSGRWNTGAMMLLSTHVMAPAARAMAAMAAMSQICMRGLVGDSTMTSLVRPGWMAARTALGEEKKESDEHQ